MDLEYFSIKAMYISAADFAVLPKRVIIWTRQYIFMPGVVCDSDALRQR
jgi:hypothetical protein